MRRDCRVTWASDGKQALESMARKSFDLVITDVVMPGELNGIDVLRSAKEAAPTCQVIVMSGNTSQDAVASAHELGAVYIRKPFDLEVMRAAVSKALDAGSSHVEEKAS